MNHLYIHIPFCASRCGYCDFFSQAGCLSQGEAYVDALLAELADSGIVGQAEHLPGELAKCGTGSMDDSAAGPGGLATVYLGGGTPTLLGSRLLERLLSALRPLCRERAEITVEANPSTVTPELAAGLAESGVNRVSLGAQSFNRRLRKNLGRAGPMEAIGRAVKALRAAGFENVGLDLMFSIPEQTLADLEQDLIQALALEPEHISCYELTVKDGSDYQRRWQRQLEEVAGNGHRFYETVVDTLEGAGYRWYETSNYAHPGKECRHNLAYWQRADFFGLGAGAWSSQGLNRWRNVEDAGAYIEGAALGDWEGIREHERLSERQQLTELLMLGLRVKNGIDRQTVAEALDGEQENILLRNGFLLNEGGRILLTRRGRFMANEVCARLIKD
ncbi:MAG: radical SAM family heme chaperone HemW [Thermoleophilia bacterium]|nr:radical SAM family heme chaperone HemW [Thermoleophilia bacterium]